MELTLVCLKYPVKQRGNLDEGLEYLGVKEIRLRPSIPFCDYFKGLLMVKRWFIGSFTPQCIILIADDDNPPLDRDGFPFQAPRITCAIPPLMMIQGNRGDHLDGRV